MGRLGVNCADAKEGKMKPSEFKQAITMLRDSESETDFIVHLYDLVDQGDPAAEEKVLSHGGNKPKRGHKKAHAETEDKKLDPAAEKRPKWKPKKCEICGEIFQPETNRQMRCEKCRKITPEQDVKHTAAELASMA